MDEDLSDSERRRLQQRLVELRNQLAELSGGTHEFGPAGDGLTLEMEVAFLERIIAFETAPTTNWVNALSESGYDMPDPATLSDTEIGLEVWQVIQRLAELHAYLYHTNHLSDRELYEHLYHDSLREESVHPPPDPDSTCHIDLIGSGSDHDLDLYLRYYADERERQDWVEQFPDDALPPREKPPFERDHLLPQRTDPEDELATRINSLLDADWEDPGGPVRLSADLTHDQVQSSVLYQTARVLLETLRETGSVKATAKLGNLPRFFVRQIYPHLPLSPDVRAMHDTLSKRLDEPDLAILHKARFAAEDGGLVQLRGGMFQLTAKGAHLLDTARAGELYRTLFLPLFRKINLGYFDRLPDVPGIQSTAAVVLWRLGTVARDWIPLDQLVHETLLPDVIDEILHECGPHRDPGLALEGRLLCHLEDFGLLESNTPHSFRLTPLFDRFVSFGP